MSGTFDPRRGRKVPPPNRPVWIHIACNGDQGEFAGKAEGITVNAGGGIDRGGTLLELEPKRGSPRFYDRGAVIRIGRRWWPIVESREWVGNYCWNAYALPLERAVDFLEWLHGHGLFSCIAAMDPCLDLWDAPSWSPADREALAVGLSVMPA